MNMILFYFNILLMTLLDLFIFKIILFLVYHSYILGLVRLDLYTSFQQQNDESIPEAWECFQDYILECPHHGMESLLLMQMFYHGLGNNARETMDAVAGGAFLSLTISQATALVEKMASNQSWNEKGPRHAREVEVCISSRK